MIWCNVYERWHHSYEIWFKIGQGFIRKILGSGSDGETPGIWVVPVLAIMNNAAMYIYFMVDHTLLQEM